MAAESTTTTLNDITYSAAIDTAFLATLAEHSLPMGFCREKDLRWLPSSAADFPYLDSDFGSADDDGAGVDTEYNATQGTALSNTELSTSKVTITAAEYGIQIEITDNVIEDSVSGIDLMQAIDMHAGRALALAWTDDFCALFAGLSNSVGSTGVDVTVTNMLSAQTGIRRRGGVAEDGLVYVLDNQQADDLEGVLVSTNAAAAIFANTADRVLQADIGPNNGMGSSRMVLAFRGYPVIATGLTDTANAGADVVGACLTPDGPRNRPYATFGNVIKRLPRIEVDRDISKRTDMMVVSMRMAPGELLDATGTKIVTEA